ncbi:hydroxyethylthiazole kinase [Natrarchaeobaculum sulfurireducens]|uniref:Hydroxyethylthiazole kinase n=1 Tax=Natrarchaeobaculum sulfurireducens TaxID=2044521 RepID=A0A346PVE8_9EURY|nr:hydroxyethylthiazole kinase [Natrarchaeobaculum sulfurireducens]AXR79754.1 Hydroxyethylthiazole kinase, sugar kinase family [Natrarchaeobaculum sulfurireducens]AXR83493.1 Hydroxyethylthiazole kinase [Natrarchaeobaculum sulfurireducens]
MTAPSTADVTGADLAASLERLADAEPLVQSLTNTVTINDVANVVLHWNALPVMADTPGDAGEMAELASALVLNIGQVPDQRVEAMVEAGRTANDRGIPVVLDPVGVGSTPTRESVAERLLSELEFAVVKGNYGEVSALAGVEAEVKGVESVGEYDEIEDAARVLADSTGATVVASGVEDVVADTDGVVRISAGHEMLGAVVGTGCMLGGTIGAFCGALEDTHVAALYATLAFGIAGEHAADLEYEGPGSYRTNFRDAVAGLSPEVAAGLALEDRIVPIE